MFIERLPRTYELQFLDEAQKKATVNRPIPLYSKKIFSIYITSWFNYIIEQIMTSDFCKKFNIIMLFLFKICQIITTEFSLYLANFLWLQLKPKIVIRRISY